MNKNKRKINKKYLKIGSFSIAMAAVVIAVVVIANLIVSNLPSTYTHLSMSSEDYYSISDETVEILDGVDTDVTMYLIAEKGNENSKIEELLTRYKERCSHITVKTIDPVTNPTFVSQYTNDNLNPNSVIVESSLRSYVINYTDIFTTEYSDEEIQYYYYYGIMPTGTTYFNGEMMFTTAIDYVTTDNLPTMYTLSGHGEGTLSETYSEYVKKENVGISELKLLGAGSIPDDCGLLFINAPTSDITEDEAELISSYIDEGGNILLITDFSSYSSEKMPNLAGICAKAGLSSVDGITIENDSNMNINDDYPYVLLPEISGEAESPAGLLDSQNIYVVMSGAHGIIKSDDTDATVTPILSTSSSAIVKSKSAGEKIETFEKEDGDYEGEVNLGAVSKGTADGTRNDSYKFIWYSSSSLVNDDINAMSGSGNAKMFVSTLNYTLDKKVSVSILGKLMTSESLVVTEMQRNLWLTVICIVIPVAVIGSGFAVWYTRRRR